MGRASGVLADLLIKRLPTADCVEWERTKDRNGYGLASWWTWGGEQRHTTAHRLAYIVMVGTVPSGFTIDHLCRNRSCVNPAHLEAVPPVVNTARGTGKANLAIRAKLLTGRCPSGHEDWNDSGQCKSCIAERNRRNRATIRAAYQSLGLKRADYYAAYGHRLDTARQIIKAASHV